MSIHPHDVRELLGPQSTTTRVSDEQVARMVAVLNTCRAQDDSGEGARLPVDEPSAGAGQDRTGELPTA